VLAAWSLGLHFGLCSFVGLLEVRLRAWRLPVIRRLFLKKIIYRLLNCLATRLKGGKTFPPIQRWLEVFINFENASPFEKFLFLCYLKKICITWLRVAAALLQLLSPPFLLARLRLHPSIAQKGDCMTLSCLD
jgi:hypothetical protein